MSDRPRRITLLHQSEREDPNPGRGRYVGTTGDGRRFFITTPFVWAIAKSELAGRDYVALYLWDADGGFESAHFEHVAKREPGRPCLETRSRPTRTRKAFDACSRKSAR